ncbi:hypothetical protein UNSWCS_1328 [Campylobacter concisus UNSWCS]|uniref:Uncharacterized protein n=1 Tax=Campylobacter concisus UNSWCS TaxID=1242968 RepID=U2EP66_9BACT|nr:hypothetical protein UNSWCS_1328 [Campylobacter concisus UNSWCS]
MIYYDVCKNFKFKNLEVQKTFKFKKTEVLRLLILIKLVGGGMFL